LRVQPKVPIPIEIQNNNKKINASLADLSVQGVDKFVLGVLAESEFNLRQNQEVDLWVNLPFSESPIHVCGVAGHHSFDQKETCTG